MSRATAVAHQFVDVVPDDLAEGIVYVCIPHTTAMHLCLCGCGEEVVTPIKPTGWRLTFNGIAVSLHPSIGNWDFPCHSHYWITDGRVRWDRQWSPAEIAAARRQESAHRAAYFDGPVPASSTTPAPTPPDPTPAREARRPRPVPRQSWLKDRWHRLMNGRRPKK
ncbi:DUF6527 family protein [Actinoplanes sp. NPDC051859]|uniref:DUF6527 family protein n=1 Tax=Actinoplanes sp. NPDC051859 TaxID=3363909 RepID=UPI003792FEF9